MTTHTEIPTLAAATVAGALTRMVPLGATKKGRVIAEFRGERTEAEAQWFEMCAVLALVRMMRRSFVTEMA